MVCLSRKYPFKIFKGCLSKILLGSLLNTWTHFLLWLHLTCKLDLTNPISKSILKTKAQLDHRSHLLDKPKQVNI